MVLAETHDQLRKFTAADHDHVAPFVPSPLPIVHRMLELARVTPGDTVFDLGSGDGRIVIMAAQQFGAEAVGVELDEGLFKQSSARVAQLGLQPRARILHADLFDTDVRSATVVTLYLLSSANRRLRPSLERQLRLGARVVCHDFPVPGWQHEKLVTGVLEDGSPHALYLYTVGRAKEEAMPITTTNRAYVAGKFALELDGAVAGFLESAEGGYATADVVVEKLGPDHIVRKHLAGVKYEDITMTCGTGMSKGFYGWLLSTFDRRFTRENGAIVEYDYNYTEQSRLTFFKALVTEIGFPALDAASKDAASMTVNVTPEYTRFQSAQGGGPRYSSPKTIQKKWLPSNFRLRIDGLDCTRVNKIEALKVKMKVAERAVGEQRDYELEPAHLEIPNVVVTLEESHADEFYKWHEDFVIKGNNAPGQEKNGTLEYLAPNLQEVLFSLELRRLGIFKLTPEKVEAGSENIRRVKAEMYCEDLALTIGGGVAEDTLSGPAVAMGIVATGIKESQGTIATSSELVSPVRRTLRFRS